MKRLAIILSFLCLPLSVPAAAEELVADLSDHLVEITMGFEGAELLLFGAVEGEGDVVVLVHGPTEDLTVRRKDKLGPIWMNRGEMSFAGVPAFYRVMSTQLPSGWLPEAVRERHQIGVDHLRLPPRDGEPAAAAETKVFHDALIRRKQAVGHYGVEVGVVKMLSQRLFRTDVSFPTNVPVGNYTVEIFLIQDGKVVSAQTTPLYISKTGVLAEIFFFAHDYAAIYGVLAIIFAVLAGLGANAVFRKV
jgi:uncharacterized protein (TIGR02186 family)